MTLPVIRSGLRALCRLKCTADSGAAIAAVFALIQNILFLFFSPGANVVAHLFGAAAGLLLAACMTGKAMLASSIARNFQFCTQESPLYTVQKVPNEEDAYEIGRGFCLAIRTFASPPHGFPGALPRAIRAFGAGRQAMCETRPCRTSAFGCCGNCRFHPSEKCCIWLFCYDRAILHFDARSPLIGRGPAAFPREPLPQCRRRHGFRATPPQRIAARQTPLCSTRRIFFNMAAAISTGLNPFMACAWTNRFWNCCQRWSSAGGSTW